MSLVIIPAIALYVICVVALPIFMFRWARRRKWATRRRWTAAVAGLLILTVPVFWDWAPTVWLHSHYCHSYAGLTVNKAPRQWSDENPGIVETLVRPKILSQTGSWPDFAIDLNDRLRREVRSIKKPFRSQRTGSSSWIRRPEKCSCSSSIFPQVNPAALSIALET